MTETANTEPLNQALEVVSAPTAEKNVRELIERNLEPLSKALGTALTVEQFETAAMTYLRQNPKLWECDPYSVVGGLRLGAQLGLQLGPLGHFYLVPYNKRAQFILGYKGMTELAYRSGKLKRITARVVREGDDFEYRYGTRAFLDHKPQDEDGERAWTAVYAVAQLTNGGTPFIVLNPEKVTKRRESSASWKLPDSPWQKHPEAMWRKTAVRALQPELPQTPAAFVAASQDEEVVTALDGGEDVWRDQCVYGSGT